MSIETVSLGTNETASLNPLYAARTEPEFLIRFLEGVNEAPFSCEKKEMLLALISDLPADASMRDLLDAIKAKEVADLGITPDQYEALGPLLLALQQLDAGGDHGCHFNTPVDAG